MYHRGRQKMRYLLISAIILLSWPHSSAKTVTATDKNDITIDDSIDNNIIDFDEELSIKYERTNQNDKESHRYIIIKDDDKNTDYGSKNEEIDTKLETSTLDFSVIPLELTSTTEINILKRVNEDTDEPKLRVIPLQKKVITEISESQNITSTEYVPNYQDTTTEFTEQAKFSEDLATVNVTESIEITSNNYETTTDFDTMQTSSLFNMEIVVTTDKPQIVTKIEKEDFEESTTNINNPEFDPTNTKNPNDMSNNTETNLPSTERFDSDVNNTSSDLIDLNNTTKKVTNTEDPTSELNLNKTEMKVINPERLKTNLNETSSETNDKSNSSVEIVSRVDFSDSDEADVPIFTELDAEDEVEVPEDYYDSKDVVPTTAPKTDALSVIFGIAGSVVESVVESVAERVVPKGLVDLFKRMQRQSEAIEAEKLRSREENGGIGQFGRGILKSISSGISKPFSQLMAGVKDIGSLDTDRGFVASVASGVTSVANVATSVADAFKDKVQAIYPGTVWCGDGRSATARSSDLGLFFFTDTCCRQHDSCKIYIKSGETKYGLTNTGLFTRSHCSCDTKFRDCLRRTNSLVSAQIGLTYFNVLGPQCFRKAHPIIKCVKRTRITGQKCEEYELDYTKPKMWQWFDSETF